MLVYGNEGHIERLTPVQRDQLNRHRTSSKKGSVKLPFCSHNPLFSTSSESETGAQALPYDSDQARGHQADDDEEPEGPPTKKQKSAK